MRRLTRLTARLFGGEANYLSSRHPDLDSLMATMKSLTDADLVLLANSWQRENDEVRRKAWTNALRSIDDAGHRDALDEVRNAVGVWAQSRPSDFQGVEGLLGDAGVPASWRQAAAPAIIDKAAAILSRELLDESDYLVLARPWDSLPEVA